MELGCLSAKYESNGDPGCIARTAGDAGGASYGAYQFANASGIPQSFVNFLNDRGYAFGQLLGQFEPDTAEFDQQWRELAEQSPEEFLELQRRYVEEHYYIPACDRAAQIGITIDNHSFALQNVLWSAAVQYGVYYGGGELFEDAAALMGYPNPSYLDEKQFDRELIKAIYEVRASDEWTSGSPSLRYGLRNRFAQECDDALAILESELGC
jgi:hypothetical protein